MKDRLKLEISYSWTTFIWNIDKIFPDFGVQVMLLLWHIVILLKDRYYNLIERPENFIVVFYGFKTSYLDVDDVVQT
jgi:hypothetical protein